RTYEEYGRYEQGGQFRFAPAMCAAPSTPDDRLRISNSKDTETHGRKLYSLFVNKKAPGAMPGCYAARRGPNPVGQVIVKEAWEAEKLPQGERLPASIKRKVKVRRDGKLIDKTDSFTPYARDKDGQVYRTTRKADLFIMFKVNPSTPDTDGGWVYG